MTDLKECKIIDTIDVTNPNNIIQTPCGKFLIGVEGYSIFRYCLKTKQKIRIAGSVDQPGYQDDTRNESRLNSPRDLILSKDGKTLFVADGCNCLIRAICVVTGVTTTFAGQVNSRKSIDGPNEKACFYLPKGLKLSPNGNTLFVADRDKLRTICIATGQVDTICTVEKGFRDFEFSPDGKHVIILNSTQILKYNLETCKSDIILEDKGYFVCELSKDGQLLFISKMWNEEIIIINLVTNRIIDIIPFKTSNITISTNGKQLYVLDGFYNKIQVLDISEYCINFKTFLQLQLSKHSFLSRQVVKIISI
jgi:DNA-binding beta-propeller fold protein YncE